MILANGVLSITVTTEDITFGIRGSPRACPIARSIRRELDLKNSDVVQVMDFLLIMQGKKLSYFKLTNIAEKFIIAFDNNHEVKPHTFYFRRHTNYLF